MNIHEYQAKELFEKFGVPSPQGKVAATAEEARAIAIEIGGQVVVKAQVHAGGRGKGTFKNGFQGGVHLSDDADAIGEIAGKMLGEILVTHQTGEEGRLVRKVMVAEAVDIEKEYYLAILMDRDSRSPVIVASTEGGMDIEAVAENTPEKILNEPVHPLAGLQPFQIRKLASKLGLAGNDAKQFAKLLKSLYRLFLECDCSMVEINPLVTTPDGQVLALDAKFGFDDNALYRQPEIEAMRDTEEEDPREVAAAEFDLNYIGLDGNIACLVNGAGLAMATMDIIKHYGGDPANFLDVGGGATKEQVTNAFKIILSDPNVKGILVNIFGGIMDCDVIAHGIVAAAKEVEITIPLIVRLEGNNVAAGKKTLAESGVALIAADDLADAAKKAVARSFKAQVSSVQVPLTRVEEKPDIILRFSRRYAMAHRLTSGAAPNCRVPHGHDEVVTVDIASTTGAGLDPETNMLVEFEKAKGRWFEWIDSAVDHSFHLGDADPLIEYFRQNEPELLPKLLVTPGDPTTEIRAACYRAKLTALLDADGHGLICNRLQIQETPTNAVEISGGEIRGLLDPGEAHWWNRPDLTIGDL